MSENLHLFSHHHIDNNADRTLFLLHGTGGGAEDFLFLNDPLKESYNVVGLKGNIDKNGMARFFKRDGIGVFDQDSIREEVGKFMEFLTAWSQTHNVSTASMVFLGYSNGANMLLASLFLHPSFFQTLVLLHPMMPFAIQDGSTNLSNTKVFVSIGERDHMVSSDEQARVIRSLEQCGADVAEKVYPYGHGIQRIEIDDAISFLRSV